MRSMSWQGDESRLGSVEREEVDISSACWFVSHLQTISHRKRRPIGGKYHDSLHTMQPRIWSSSAVSERMRGMHIQESYKRSRLAEQGTTACALSVHVAGAVGPNRSPKLHHKD
jgi:hypothetical protein